MAPVTARPRRPLSIRASTASWSIRFSLRTMMSGRVELDEPLEAVVAVDYAAIEVVQVAGGKAAAVELDHGADLSGMTGRTSITIHSGRLPL